VVAITLDGITVRYFERSDGAGRAVDALDDLSLDVASGELLVLSGPSGSGKTTVLRTIAGLERPVRGVVRLDGRVVNNLPPGARDVALVTQFDSLFPHLTVEQNLAFALQVRKLPADETTRRVRAEARVLGLWSKLGRRPRELSNGERQKAALGRATTRRPGVYLLDEPLAGLDAGERDHLRRELRRLQRGLGVTTVYVTHDQRDAMALGDRIAVLDRGRLVQIAEPLALYRLPANLFVARFFGSPPMGLIRGRLHDDGSTAWVDAGGIPLRLLPAQRAAVAAAGHSETVVVGVRAAAVQIGHGPLQEWSRHLDLVVRGVETLGAYAVVALTPPTQAGVTADRLYTTVPPAHRPVLGERHAVTIDMRHSFIFDAGTGQRLSTLLDSYAQ
jgi:multiple sugar transport system ATP-binding protein